MHYSILENKRREIKDGIKLFQIEFNKQHSQTADLALARLAELEAQLLAVERMMRNNESTGHCYGDH